MKTDPKPGVPGPASEGPVLLQALNLTMRTVERRTRLYRNLVVAVSVTGIASMTAAALYRRWIIVVGILALPGFVALFLVIDRRLVLGWRRQLLAMRDERGLNLSELERTLSGFRHLPQATLQSMVALVKSPEP